MARIVGDPQRRVVAAWRYASRVAVMLSVIRVVLVVALSSSLSLVASAATADRQASATIPDALIGIDTQEQTFFTHIYALFQVDVLYGDAACRCDDIYMSESSLVDAHITRPGECFYPKYRMHYEQDDSCNCDDSPRFRAIDDSIRGQMAFSDHPLSILPLWEIDTALEIEEHVRLAWNDSGCGSGSIGTLGGMNGGRSLGLSASSAYGAGGLAGAASGGGAFGLGLIDGGSSGGSGSLVDVSSRLEDSPTVEAPIPTPLPPAALLFLTALSAFGLIGGVRRRLAAKA